MKRKFFILLLLANSASAADLRLVDTNLYDFSGAGSIYHVCGTVSKIYPQSIEIKIFGFRLVDGQIAIRLMNDDPESMRTALAAYAIGINEANGIRTTRLLNQTEYRALSPELQQYFEPASITMFLLNSPATEVGQVIDAVAVPTPNKGFYDCGKTFTGDTNQFRKMYYVLQDRIVGIFTANEIKRQHETSDKNLFIWQQHEASNNVAYVQFDLGQRYLKGVGVETNQVLAYYWIGRSASNSFPGAIKFLEKFPAKP